MGKFVFAYQGGGGMAEAPEEQEKAMAAWGAWFGQLGDAVVDGGNPFGASRRLTADGSMTEGAGSQLTGFSVVTAPSLEVAVDMAKGCPIRDDGGTVDVYEAIEM